MSKWGSVFLVLVLGVAISFANPGHYVHDYYKHGMGEEVRNNIFHETEMKKRSWGLESFTSSLKDFGDLSRSLSKALFGGIRSKLYQQETQWTALFGKPWLKGLISRLCGKLLVVLAQRIRCDKTQQQMHFIAIHQRNSKKKETV